MSWCYSCSCNLGEKKKTSNTWKKSPLLASCMKVIIAFRILFTVIIIHSLEQWALLSCASQHHCIYNHRKILLTSALLLNCICVGCRESVEESVESTMAFAESGWLLRRQKHGTRSLNIPFLSEALTGVDGWFLLQATADTWYTTQMVK